MPEGPAPQDRPAPGAEEGPAVERSSITVPRLSDRRVLDLFAALARDIGDDHRPIRLTVRSIAATSFGVDLPWTTLTGVPALVYERDLDVIDEATMTLGGGGPAIAYHRGGRERPSRSPSQDEFRIVPPAAGGDEAQHPNGPAVPDVLGKITSGLLALGRPRTPYANGDASADGRPGLAEEPPAWAGEAWPARPPPERRDRPPDLPAPPPRGRARPDLLAELERCRAEARLGDPTRGLRRPIHAAFIALFAFFAAASLVHGLELAAGGPLGAATVLTGVTALLTTLGAAATGFLYVRWQIDLFDRVAEADMRLRQLELDIIRADWVVGTAAEWRAGRDERLPDDLMRSLFRVMFDEEGGP